MIWARIVRVEGEEVDHLSPQPLSRSEYDWEAVVGF